MAKTKTKVAAKAKVIPGTPELGDEVRDRITGFRGIVTGRHDYIFGCAQFSILSQDEKAGKDDRGRTLDEASLDIIKKNAVSRKPLGPETPPGGPAQPIQAVER